MVSVVEGRVMSALRARVFSLGLWGSGAAEPMSVLKFLKQSSLLKRQKALLSSTERWCMLSGGAEEVFQGQTLAKSERCIGFSEILERWKVPNGRENSVEPGQRSVGVLQSRGSSPLLKG